MAIVQVYVGHAGHSRLENDIFPRFSKIRFQKIRFDLECVRLVISEGVRTRYPHRFEALYQYFMIFHFLGVC